MFFYHSTMEAPNLALVAEILDFIDMTLIVEDGTQVVGANTFLSMTNFDAYHTVRANTTWTAGVAADKESAVFRAMAWLENYEPRWQAFRASTTQPLSWPRDGAVDTNKNAILVTTIPQLLKDALAEAAFIEFKTPGVLNPALAHGGMIQSKKIKAGPVETQTVYQSGASSETTYPHLTKLLRPLMKATNSLVRA